MCRNIREKNSRLEAIREKYEYYWLQKCPNLGYSNRTCLSNELFWRFASSFRAGKCLLCIFPPLNDRLIIDLFEIYRLNDSFDVVMYQFRNYTTVESR